MNLLIFAYLYPFAGHLEQFFDLGELDSDFIREKKELNSVSCSLDRGCEY